MARCFGSRILCVLSVIAAIISTIPGVLVGADDKDALKPVLVQVLFRHGDRSSVEMFPSDPNRAAMWPQGLGQLTKRGMNQHFTLGRYFQDRYINGKPFSLLSAAYKASELYVRSTDRDRTLMSAYSHLAGMFPPNGSQVWNPDIAWQPIPVHTVARPNETLLDADDLGKCPEFDRSWNETMQGEVVMQEEVYNKELYEYLSNKSGLPGLTIDDVWKVSDTLFCEHQHPELGFTLPAWTNKTFHNRTAYQNVRALESLQFDLKYNDTKRSRLSGGNLVGQMLTNMENMIVNTTQRKYFIFSGHDTTVAAFTSALGVYNGLAPPYATAVIMELLQGDKGDYSVRLLYKNDSTAEPYTLTLPGCRDPCPYTDFVSLTKDSVPSDWEAECGRYNPGELSHSLLIIIIASISSVVIITVVIVAVAMWVRKQQRDGYGHYSSINVTDA